jgi:multiple sugar transport system permease protein
MTAVTATPAPRTAAAGGAGSRRTARGRWTARKAAIFAVLLVVTAFFLFPIYWALNTALQTTPQQNRLPIVWWPSKWQWKNFSTAWSGYFPFTDYLWHTLIIVFFVTVGSVASASLVAYGLSRLRYAGRDFWFNVVLSTMMLPFIVTLIPQYMIFQQLGWLNSYLPLIVPAFFGGGPFNIFLLRQFMMGIPPEIDEAAFMDGCNHWQIYSRIVLPMVRPALGVSAWMTALAAWDNFLGPLIYLSKAGTWTLSLGLFNISGAPEPGWGNQLSIGIALLVMLPVIVGFFFVQRRLIEGVNLTGISR